jgi:hypothetical protein
MRRGTGCSHPSDHRSTAEINRERGRGLTGGLGASVALGRGWLTGRAQQQGRGRGRAPERPDLNQTVRIRYSYLKWGRPIQDRRLRSEGQPWSAFPSC